MYWETAITRMLPYLVRIEVMGAHGTGFICPHEHATDTCLVATAGHAILGALRTSSPIAITHQASGLTVSVPFSRDAVKVDFTDDVGVVAVSDLRLAAKVPPQPTFDLHPHGVFFRTGQEIGFYGFPVVGPDVPCFFWGHISARLPDDRKYLITSHVMRGVSGAPVFAWTDTGQLAVGGVAVAYRPDTRESDHAHFPGLSVAHDIVRLRVLLSSFKGITQG